MNALVSFKKILIAPCGINCGTCIAYLRPKNKCPGCRIDAVDKRKTCIGCKIKNCQHLKKTASELCYECDVFPCDIIKHIDNRYKKKYHARLIENLTTIKEKGMTYFLETESKKWTCPDCGNTLSVHRDNCLNCSYSYSSYNL